MNEEQKYHFSREYGDRVRKYSRVLYKRIFDDQEVYNSVERWYGLFRKLIHIIHTFNKNITPKVIFSPRPKKKTKILLRATHIVLEPDTT